MPESQSQSYSYCPTIHRLAIVLTVVVFLLIGLGGLVTTYDAGMAVPDWPGTYGWNMFAYPPSTWLYGPFDLLIEHTHRLWATLAGLISIGLLIAAFRWESRLWFCCWTLAVLAVVIAQGLLGGVRVLMDERTAAMMHACMAALFFAMATATAVMSSRWWVELPAGPSADNPSEIPKRSQSGRAVVWTATILVIVSYLQLIVGAQLRHVTALVRPKIFTGFVHMHLTLAMLVVILTVVLAAFSLLNRRMRAKLSPAALLLILSVFAQVALGIVTWIVNYALPWPEMTDVLAAYTINAKGYWESLIVTAHVATGSLIIGLATVIALRAWRYRHVDFAAARAE